MKIVIVIGQSASGKSTYVKQYYFKEGSRLEYEPIKHTICGAICLLGDYLEDRRCVGTDTLSYSIIDTLIQFVKDSKDRFEFIVAEGDRINNKKFFDAVKEMDVPVEVYVFSCSLNESMQRLRDQESTIGETFVKTTKSKASNMKQYAKRLGFTVHEINTGKEESSLLNF